VRRAGTLLLAVAALALPGSAEANGDPASDILLASQVFLPYEAPISKSAADGLKQTVAAANQKGFRIRVAVIAFTGDLGTAISLWKHPQEYSRFLGSEIAFVYKGRLLVAMPAGFGFYDGSKPVRKELRVLAKVQPGRTPTPLAESAAEAVRALAAAKEITLPKRAGSSATRDRLLLGAAVLAFLVVLLFPARLLGRRRGGQSPPAADRTPEPD
jgi:hypothetical protein